MLIQNKVHIPCTIFLICFTEIKDQGIIFIKEEEIFVLPNWSHLKLILKAKYIKEQYQMLLDLFTFWFTNSFFF